MKTYLGYTKPVRHARMLQAVEQRRAGKRLLDIAHDLNTSAESIRLMLLRAVEAGVLTEAEEKQLRWPLKDVFRETAELWKAGLSRRDIGTFFDIDHTTVWYRLEKCRLLGILPAEDPERSNAETLQARFNRFAQSLQGHLFWTGPRSHTEGVEYPRISWTDEQGEPHSGGARGIAWLLLKGEQPPHHLSPTCGKPMCVLPEHQGRAKTGVKKGAKKRQSQVIADLKADLNG